MVQITYIFMVMRNKIVLDQLPHRAARLKVLPFASFTPIAVVGTAARCGRDIIQYAHFPGTQLQCLGVQQTGQVHHCHAEVDGDAAHIIQLPDQPGCRYRIYIYIYAV